MSKDLYGRHVKTRLVWENVKLSTLLSTEYKKWHTHDTHNTVLPKGIFLRVRKQRIVLQRAKNWQD